MQYLKIENTGVCPTEGFTIFGASSKNDTPDSKIIGTFGSGAKHGIALALRQGLMPIIYCGKTKLAFYTKPLVIKGVKGETNHQQLCVKITGQTEDGKSVNQDKELDHTLSYGNKDWEELSLALREFVSNAIDASYEQGLDHKNVEIELVEENQVRAKAGSTRIFVPTTIDVVRFYQEINKWFLHFSSDADLECEILSKADRNCVDRFGSQNHSAVIYRRGVRVREFVSSTLPSLFDYNIKNLPIDESRTIDDWKARFECASALARTTNTTVMKKIFGSLLQRHKCWELEHDGFSMCYRIPKDNMELWQKAFRDVCGEKAVVCHQLLSDRVEEKGYVPIVLSDKQAGVYRFFSEIKLPSDASVLTENDKKGRKIIPATEAVHAAFDFVWKALSDADLLYNRDKPKLFCFKQMTEASATTLGYWVNDEIYINEDISQAESNSLLDTIMEEVAHHVTRATDGSRDFANYLIRASMTFAKKIMGKSK
jgi:hypothetical protein